MSALTTGREVLSIIEQIGLKIDQWLVKVQEAFNVSELHVTAIGNGNAILKLQDSPTYARSYRPEKPAI